jgi:O-succinylbenzoic acid--CoA ligase
MIDKLIGDNKNHFVFHQRFDYLRDELIHAITQFHLINHYFLLSSGTTSNSLKGYALSKEALEKNALAVNQHLGLTKQDKWGLTLPYYHIGGLSIFFRAHLLEHDPVALYPWSPHKIVTDISINKVTIISLVPTQIYDLVRLKIKSPSSLRYVLVGGDFISDELLIQSKKLGWPVIKTFGMTELGSQIATANKSDDQLKILPIHEIKVAGNKQLWIRSQSLFTLTFKRNANWEFEFSSNLVDGEGFYPLSDIGIVNQGHLKPMGRFDGSFKSSGHLIDLNLLKEELSKVTIEHDAWGKIEVFVENDQRKGKILCLIYENDIPLQLIEAFKSRIFPIRIDKIIQCERIERTELGKFKTSTN